MRKDISCLPLFVWYGSCFNNISLNYLFMRATAFSSSCHCESRKPVWRTWASFPSPSTVADIPLLTFTLVHAQVASAAAQVLLQNLNRNLLLLEKNHNKSAHLSANSSVISEIYFGLTPLLKYMLASFSFLCYQAWGWSSLFTSIDSAWKNHMPLWLWR